MKKVIISIKNDKFLLLVIDGNKEWKHSFVSKLKAQSVINQYRIKKFEIVVADSDQNINTNFDEIDANGNVI